MKPTFSGSSSLLLTDYLESKQELNDLRVKARFRNSDEIQQRIEHLEVKIVEIISMFDKEQLREIVFMSLDIDSDNLKELGLIS